MIYAEMSYMYVGHYVGIIKYESIGIMKMLIPAGES
jgi:hypothetical protein